MNKTTTIKKNDITRNWYIIDAEGVRLGKLACEVAKLLIGKSKVDRADYLVSGDSVVVINASKVDIHPRKLASKTYYSHSGYIGGLKEKKYKELIKTKPTFVIENAVKGMLPSTKLGRKMFKNLYVYKDTEHLQEAQNPINIKIK